MEFQLSSGAKLVVTPASFEDASALRNGIIRAAKGTPLPEDLQNMEMTDLKDFLISAVTSEEVDKAMFKCAERAVYENVRVSRGLFDDPKFQDRAREDYYEICWKIVEVNLSPFFKKTFSVLSKIRPTIPVAPAPASAPARS